MLEGGILFLEDVGEYAYRVERMLLTLLDAGILARQRAVLLGAFTNADDSIRFRVTIASRTRSHTFAAGCLRPYRW